MFLTNFFWFSTLSTVAFAMIYNSPECLPSLIFDFIIVGEGTAGSVLANRLTEIPYYQDLVIEAGPNIVPGLAVNLANSIFDWNFTTTPQAGLNGRSVEFQRGHVLGGSSSVNGMVYTRGSSSDYDRFARITGEPSWSWNALQPYVRKHEGFVPPVDGRNPAGEFDSRFHGFLGPIHTTFAALLSPSINTRILAASRQLQADFSFNLDMNSGTPLGTEFTTGNNQQSPRRVLTASKEVILSAGSIGTPHILLHSGIGDENELAKVGIHPVLHLPGVGKNLTDHPLFVVGSVLNITDDADFWGDLSTNATLEAEALQLWNKNKTGPLAVFRRFDQIVWARVAQFILPKGVDLSSGPNSAHYELALEGSATSTVPGSSIVSPASRGSVSLATNNPFDAPLIDPAYYSAAVDLAIAKESIRAFFRFVAAPVWKDVLVGPRPPLVNNPSNAFLEDFLQNTSSSNAHAIGMAEMSPVDASWGVVNPDLLKKARGLRPFVPCAHTQASVYIIAERAADIVKAAWAA
ncbi:alcohol oxidase [Agrocybe pediades]|nr:alcohol oxidase [Agrocybe pediades]